MKIWYKLNLYPKVFVFLNKPVRRWLRLSLVFLLFSYTLLFGLELPKAPTALQPEREEEVYLSFRYRGGINTIIVAYLKGDRYYIPVIELFDLLSINYQLDQTNLALTGFYLDPNQHYELGFNNRIARMGTNQLNFTASDFMIKDIDFYIQPLILKVLFGLDFTIDLSRLILSLEADDVLPIVEQYERRNKYRKGMLSKTELIDTYPLISARNRRIIDGAFIDYSLFGFVSNDGQLSSFNIGSGGEFLTGDIQGSISGTSTSQVSSSHFSDVRWRYVLQNRRLLSAVSLGQINSVGLNPKSYAGILFTNESIEPRQSYDEYVIAGTTEPESDVELYQNNRLVDFRKADEKGYYRFTIPLYYGTADIKLKIYGPSGGIFEMDSRIQIPYTFLPTGTVNYQLGFGKVQNVELPWQNQEMVVQSNITAGLSNWLTNKLGVEYNDSENKGRPVFYNSLSARIARQYLVNLDLAPDISNKISVRALYPSSTSWSIDYTDFKSKGFLNRSNLNRSLSINTYAPFSIRSIQQTVRFSTAVQDYESSSRINLNLDYSWFIKRMRLSVKYRDNLQYRAGSYVGSDGHLSLLAVYTIPRTPNINRFFRGTYFRVELKNEIISNSIEKFELQILKQVSKSGRLQCTYSHDFKRNYQGIEVGLNFDFNRLRSSSRFRSFGGLTSFTETIRGSIALDAANHELVFDNRQQVGRSGVAVRMYVDEDNSGQYEKDERILPGNAIRIENSSSRQITKSGISRLTQLLPYRRYNFTVNEAYIRDPLLVPKYKKFSVITDPNRYKQLDVPFYITGIIDGQVLRRGATGPEPIGGLRLHLKSVDSDLEMTLHTFSDGSFYAMEIPPGEYEIEIDSTQLLFLNVDCAPHKHYFGVRAIAEGDFIENLNFILTNK